MRVFLEVWTATVTTFTLAWMVLYQMKANRDAIRYEILHAQNQGREVVWANKSDSEMIALLRSGTQWDKPLADRLDNCLYNRLVPRWIQSCLE